MSIISSQILDKGQQSDITDKDNFENDDLISFQHNSAQINLYYSQLTKYSKHIRESYLFPDVINRFPQEIQQFQEESQLLPENVEYFFKLSQQNYDIKEDLNLTYIQCIDLLKICNFLEVRKLSSKIKQYIKIHNVDVDFVVQMLEYENKTRKETDNHQIKISNEIEQLLASKINECLSNEKFDQLPIQIIFRVVKQSSPELINCNKLFDIIVKSLNKFCVLFQFVDLRKLSNDRLEELCEMYSKSNENTRHYFDYLKCNLNLINEMNSRKKNLEEMNDEQRTKMKELEEKITSLQNQFNDSEKANSQMQNELNDSKSLIDELKNKMKNIETSLQEQFNEQLQNQIKNIETSFQKQFNEQLQNQINYSKELENQISQLQDKFTIAEKEIVENNKPVPFEGQIVASAENELFIHAEINLTIKHGILDTTRSKVIVSTSDVKTLGSEAYEKGRPITSLHMKTSFACQIGLYYVRCIVFNSEGESNEIVSNSVTTSANNLTFGYEGKPAKISLPQGQYKLEVWGAKGGDSTGNGMYDPRKSQSTVQGGLGGYSRGILRLNKDETFYVFVGEEGHPSNSTEGSTTKGSFPDGGGTNTTHFPDGKTVPGTGGGSTSIRIGSDTDFARVIVAGGGGGAGGSCEFTDRGGFGGGSSGGNSYCRNEQGDSGAGTQKGSSCGLGGGSKGDSGDFGKGADGKCLSGRDSGGGGGGGWYGGGSGGYGGSGHSGSGGGGSGWTFTESSFKEWKEGDSYNSSKYVLNSTYYLTDAVSLSGDEEIPKCDGNGTEHGHTGNGYAKITPL